MFIEGRGGVKQPFLVHRDVSSKCVVGAPLKDRTAASVTNAVQHVVSTHRVHGHTLKKLVFDRESAIVAAEPDIESTGVQLALKAAGQKVGIAEVTIRILREKARKSKAGVRDRYGYSPPDQWNVDLVQDVIAVYNRLPRRGQAKTPYEIFTGQTPDYIRDFRVDWGEPVIVKKPRGISTDLRVTGEWAVVVRRMMGGGGVLKVYLIASRKYAHRIHLRRAIAPDWVYTALNNISEDATIGFEEATANLEEFMANNVVGPEPRPKDSSVTIPADTTEAEFSSPEERAEEAAVTSELQEALEVLDAGEQEVFEPAVGDDAAGDEAIMEPPDPITVAGRTRSAAAMRGGDELEREADRYAEYVSMGWQEPEPEDRGKIVFGRSHRRTEANLARARDILKKAYTERKLRQEVGGLATELVNLYYAQALNTRREEAEAALLKEVSKACEKKIWHGIHEMELTPEQRALILPMMKNYIEKYSARGDFEKSKVRVLVRGDLQEIIGETEGPVCRVETIFILLCIAIIMELEAMKADVSSAYMNTDMPIQSVKHRWVLLDVDVVRVLLQLDSAYWSQFVREDGKILVEMDKLMYGYKEAAHFWNKTLIGVFIGAGYKQSKKDPCLLYRKEGGKVAYVAITVDDCFFVGTEDKQWMDAQLKILEDAFGEITTERGDKQQIIGMAVDLDRAGSKVTISQKNYAKSLSENFNINKSSVTPATEDLFSEDDTSPLLKDQRKYMSLVSTLMYGVKRTYAECLVTVVILSTKYNHATENDWNKAIRVAEYIYGTIDGHCMVLQPSSLQVVASSDASYAEHADGRSHTGGCVGFESNTCAWIAYISQKQPQVAKSTCVSELYAVNTVGEYVEWMVQLMEEIGYPQGTVRISQDNQCAMQLMKVGTGSFKRSKHVKVRYFWLKELIDEGRVQIYYVPSEVLVSDALTKPITGARFRALRLLLIGW
jgi:hypothetical protein